MDLVGKVLANRYEILTQLGGGGMSIVYKAKCTFLNRDVTVKVLRPEFTSDEEFVLRFRREAQSVASLSHPNIVNVYDVGHEGDIHYIVMEYVEGSNLKELIRQQGRLPIRDAVEIAKQICDGLEHAHENNIIHRDIKPHNILITKTGRVKVTDFGIARAATSSTVTHTGTIVGSVHYFSPEQAKGEMTGVRSDIYSLGVVLYEMLTGNVPFQGESPIAIALKQIQEGPVPPQELNPEIPDNLEKIVLRSMAKNPADRYQTAREMKLDLENVFSGQISTTTKAIEADEFATQVLPMGNLGKVPNVIRNTPEPEKPKPKKRWKPWIWAVLVLLLIGVGFGSFQLFTAYMRGVEVKVPKVVGETEETAKQLLQEQGLQMKVRSYRFDDKVEKGYVVYQSEPANRVVKKGRQILVDISKGQELVKVPDLTSQDKEGAQVTLQNAQLNLGKVETEYNEEVPKGQVIKQNPKADAEVAKGSEVDIWESLGPEPQWVPVPNLVGMTPDEARAALEAQNLVLDTNYTYQESPDYFEGTIIGQDPGSDNQQVQEGTSIKVVISQGPGPEAKTATYRVTLPSDGLTHQVEVKVFDKKDPEGRSIYQQQHTGGDVVMIDVTYYGSGYLQVYLDGQPFSNRQELK